MTTDNNDIDNGIHGIDEMIRRGKVDNAIAEIPEGTEIHEVVEQLRAKGFDAKACESIVEVRYECGQIDRFDPHFIWTREREGYIRAANTLSDYMCIDETENAIDSLEAAASLASRSMNVKWKWTLVALHHSLYSFMIAALTQGNTDNVIEWGRKQDDGRLLERNSRFWRSKMCPHEKYPDAYTIKWEPLSAQPEINPNLSDNLESKNEKRRVKHKKIIGFLTALARVMDGHFFMNSYYPQRECNLKLTDDEWEGIIIASQVRNMLVHFSPALHSFSVELLESSCSHLLKAIEFISALPLYINYSHPDVDRQRVKSALATLREQLSKKNR